MKIRVALLGLLFSLIIQTGFAKEVGVACGSQYIMALVYSLTGSEIEAQLFVDPEKDPFQFQALGEEQQAIVANSSLLIIHKGQKSLLRELNKFKSKETDIIILDHKPLTIPLNYYETAQQLKKSLARNYPELDVYMAERLNEVKEKANGLDGKLLAKGRDLNLPNVNCVVARRQAAFAQWLGFRVIAEFGNDSTMTEKETAEIISQAEQKGCWLVIANQLDGSSKVGNEIRDAIGGDIVVLSDNPSQNNMIDIPEWQTLLENNANRLFDAVVWH